MVHDVFPMKELFSRNNCIENAKSKSIEPKLISECINKLLETSYFLSYLIHQLINTNYI